MRVAKYAGSFYPGKTDELFSMIQNFLKQTSEKPLGKIKAAIVPHAGYVYSGLTAAFAYNAIADQKPKKIILIGPSHQAPTQGAYTFSEPWQTPLGEQKIIPVPLPVIENDFEHSLEVQLPFLQTTLKKFDFTPIIYGNISPKELEKVVAPLIKKDSVIIASSDLSHYLPYEEAKKVDSKTIKQIMELDFNSLIREGDACGLIGIATLVLLAKKNNWKPVLLDYRNSGDTAGDKKGVVGYASIVFTE